jgi:glyoxylase-like metal-dependent hydrolase (beta-lactamase superfamily II)
MQGANVAGFKTWIGEGRNVEPLTGDKDVFSDGSVIVLRMPGHTPGHSCLLVRLTEMGPVLLTGDLVHFRENYESGGVPSFNFDRAATVASIERMKQIIAKSQSDRRHPARHARHRQAAGVPGGREVAPKPSGKGPSRAAGDVRARGAAAVVLRRCDCLRRDCQ